MLFINNLVLSNHIIVLVLSNHIFILVLSYYIKEFPTFIGEPNLLEALELAQNRFSSDGRNGVEKVMALFLSGDLTIGNAENVVAAELLNDGNMFCL